MQTLRITIEKRIDHYRGYATNSKGVYVADDTFEKAKASTLETINLSKKHYIPSNIPAILKNDYASISLLK